MKLTEITSFLEKIAPLSLQEEYDNSGLIIGSHNLLVDAALITIDCTELVVDEAIQNGCNLIIAHHPVIFNPIKKLNGNDYIQRTIIKALKNDIAIYAIHTNLDCIENGVSSTISKRLGLRDTKVLCQKNLSPNLNFGYGIIGSLGSTVNAKDFLISLKSIMKTSCIRHTNLTKKEIKNVAVCGGSGSAFLSNAKELNADIYISSDFKYHEFFDADDDIIIADIGHFESEQFTKELIYDLLTKNFTKFAVRLSKVNTNPINYL